MFKKIAYFVLFVSHLIVLAQAAPLRVVTSFSILADWTQQIGGERVRVQNIVPVDTDSHHYEVTAQNMRALQQAQLVVKQGLHFDAWLDRLIPLGAGAPKVWQATQGLSLLKNTEGAFDPHTWQDIVRSQQSVTQLAQVLIQLDPAGKSYYQQRLQAYLQQLQATQVWAQSQFAGIPEKKRIMLTSHDAFAYLGNRFGLRVLAIQGINPDAEVRPQQLAKIIRQVRQNGVRAIFLENTGNAALVRQLEAETKVRLAGKLLTDALTANNGVAPTYLQFYRYNVSVLLQGLTAP